MNTRLNQSLATLLFLAAVGCGELKVSLRSEADPSFSLAETERGSVPAFVRGTIGCSGAHCDGQNSDLSNMPAVPSNSKILAQETRFGGSLVGLGCSSNGTAFVCSYGPSADLGTQTNLAMFDADGKLKWQAPNMFLGGLSGLASASAPLIDTSGQVIAADEKKMIRFSKTGTKVWSASYPSSGFPISPVLLPDGSIFLARKGGSSLVYNVKDGALIGELDLKLTAGDPNRFDTINTPASKGQRSYVLTAYSSTVETDPNFQLGRLYAIDVDGANPDKTKRLKVAWFFEFKGPSGASPTVIKDRIYFDANGEKGGVARPTVFGIQDKGTSFVQLFASTSIVKPAQASFAVDPRGGMWLYGLGETDIVRINETTGAEIDRINISPLVGESTPFGPASAITVSGTTANPILTMSAIQTSSFGNAYVLGVNVVNKTKTFIVKAGSNSLLSTAAGQFPMLKNSKGKLRTVFTTITSGPYIVGVP